MSYIGRPGRKFAGSDVTTSAELTNTNTETVLNTVTIPGGTLQAGQEVRVSGLGQVLQIAGVDNLDLRIRIGGLTGQEVGVSSAAPIGPGYIQAYREQAPGDWLNVYVKTDGATGQFLEQSAGLFPGGGIDMTADIDVVLTGEWGGTPSASNRMVGTALHVEVL